jgi:hypothetical protein
MRRLAGPSQVPPAGASQIMIRKISLPRRPANRIERAFPAHWPPASVHVSR